MYSAGAELRHMNCSHDLNKYINGVFVKDDYCDSCLEQINEIDNDN